MQLQFKKCNSSNIKELVIISKKTFIDAFEEANDPKDFENYIASAFKEEKLRSELKDANSSFYFVYVDSVLVGYFKLNENNAQTDLRLTDSMELERIYVLKKFQGQGIGEKILLKAKRIAVEAEKTFLWLGVWEHNTGAIQFYRRHGFFKIGTHPYFIGKDEQTDWLLRLDL